MRYVPPFDLLKGFMTLSSERGQLKVSGPYEDFIKLLHTLIAGIEVDEGWYLERYPDIAEAIRQGLVPSAQQHFTRDGYFEGRQPYPITIDEAFYLEKYPGIADAIREGIVASAQQHFDENGYHEGRQPFALASGDLP
ncbi:MAG: hypothetical protein P4L71_06540 [Acetobacteraceae bacterium]|nr:hypothetical protein [Acetobacteraceae bacterium]